MRLCATVLISVLFFAPTGARADVSVGTGETFDHARLFRAPVGTWVEYETRFRDSVDHLRYTLTAKTATGFTLELLMPSRHGASTTLGYDYEVDAGGRWRNVRSRRLDAGRWVEQPFPPAPKQRLRLLGGAVELVTTPAGRFPCRRYQDEGEGVLYRTLWLTDSPLPFRLIKGESRGGLTMTLVGRSAT